MDVKSKPKNQNYRGQIPSLHTSDVNFCSLFTMLTLLTTVNLTKHVCIWKEQIKGEYGLLPPPCHWVFALYPTLSKLTNIFVNWFFMLSFPL